MRTSASLLVRRPRRKGSKGRRPKHPDDEKACEFARGPSGVPGQTSPSLTGSSLPWWSRSARTERESELVEPRPPSPCTQLGSLECRSFARARSADSGLMSAPWTPTPRSPSMPSSAQPSSLPTSRVFGRARLLASQSRPTACTARASGVLHGGRGFVQYAQPTASTSRPSCSGSPGRGRRPHGLL